LGAVQFSEIWLSGCEHPRFCKMLEFQDMRFKESTENSFSMLMFIVTGVREIGSV